MTDRQLRVRASQVIDRAVSTLEEGSCDPGLVNAAALSRRGFFRVGSTSLAMALLAGCDSKGPDGARKLLDFATRRNEVVERWLLRHTAMDHARASAVNAGAQFPSYFISKVVPTWDAAANGPWMLEVAGLVRTPLTMSLAQLMALPRTEQRVDHFCVEGWNAVATFGGVSMREIAKLAGPLPGAGYVDFASYDDGYHESWDLESTMHPQTMIVLAKDGQLLSPAYGAPARIHSPIKLGYKNTKYLTRITFMTERNGGYWTDNGYEWFGGT